MQHSSALARGCERAQQRAQQCRRRAGPPAGRRRRPDHRECLPLQGVAHRDFRAPDRARSLAPPGGRARDATPRSRWPRSRGSHRSPAVSTGPLVHPLRPSGSERPSIAAQCDCQNRTEGRFFFCRRPRARPARHFSARERTDMSAETILVAGAGGFIGGHLVAKLRDQGHTVRAVDIKPLTEWYQVFEDVDNRVADLKQREECMRACQAADTVYQLAADMGGMGFIENNKALCMLSVLTNTHMLQAAQAAGVRRFFYSSSACVYNADKQRSEDVVALREEDAYPAMPEDGYGWEKLFSERMCRHFREDFGLTTRVARFHNVYGPHGTWEGGRGKAPAAICRKVINAKATGDHRIEIWGDGHQTRSFMYIDDCLKGTLAITARDILEPINLGSSELVTINQLVDLVEHIAGVRLERRYNLGAPKGVNGRNSDNTRIRQYLGWEPSTTLRDGLEKTYRWIHEAYMQRYS